MPYTNNPCPKGCAWALNNMNFYKASRSVLWRSPVSGVLECKTCGYQESDEETERFQKTLLSEDQALKILNDKLLISLFETSFYPDSLDISKENPRNIFIIASVAEKHPELFSISYNNKKRTKINIAGKLWNQKAEEYIDKRVNILKSLTPKELENRNLHRLENPYLGRDKEYWHKDRNDNKSRRGSQDFYRKVMPKLEERFGSDFIYLRGDKGRYGVVSIPKDKPDVLEYATYEIESFYVPDGTLMKHFSLNPSFKLSFSLEKWILKETNRWLRLKNNSSFRTEE